MLNVVVVLIILIIIHALADFFLQGSKLSKLKTVKIPYLLEHVGIYTLVFIVLSPLTLCLTFLQGLMYSLINGVLHFVVDYFTGIFKRKYWESNESNFVAVMGLDHTVHILTLIITYYLLFPDIVNSPYFWN